MTRDEMLGAIEAMRLQLGWRDPTPETERLRDEVLRTVESIEARAREARDMATIQGLQRELDGVMPWYDKQLAALKRGH